MNFYCGLVCASAMAGTRRKDRDEPSDGDDDAGPSQPSQRFQTAVAHAEELPVLCGRAGQVSLGDRYEGVCGHSFLILMWV